MLLDVESLRCFVMVADTLSFRVAAQRLALSPAALSDRIRRLESLLEAELLFRTTRQVALTAAGRRLLAGARQLLADNALLPALARGEGKPLPMELLLGTRYDLGLSWLVPNLPSLKQNHPERTIHLHFGEGSELLEAVRKGLVDCAITSAPIVDGSLDYRLLHPETYAFVGASALLAEHPIRQAGDVLAHALLDLTPQLPLFRYFLDAIGESAPWRFGCSEHLGTIGAVRLRLLQGAGVAVLPTYFVARDLKEGRLKRILGGLRLRTDHFRLIWRKHHPKAEAIERLGVELKKRPLR